MLVTSKTIHSITISVSDFQEWLAANVDALVPSDAMVMPPSVDDGRSMDIVFAVSPDWLDTFLRIQIPDLPPMGSYSLNFLFGENDNVGTVMWNA